MKIYYMNRISEKQLDGVEIPGLDVFENDPEAGLFVQRVPNYVSSNKSNIMSKSENLLLRWLELNYIAQHKKEVRYDNFEKDLKTGWALYALIKNYTIGSERITKELKLKKKSQI